MARHKYYETLYILGPNLGEEERTRIDDRLRGIVGGFEGEILRFDKWGEKILTYRINGHRKGIYHLLLYKALPDVVSQIERTLKLMSGEVLRFMTVQVKEETALKRSESAQKQTGEGGA